MSLSRRCFLTAVLSMAAGASAADTTPVPATKDKPVKKKLKVDEPMDGGMMKPGMVKGDMKKAAAAKERQMDEMMKKEEKAK